MSRNLSKPRDPSILLVVEVYNYYFTRNVDKIISMLDTDVIATVHYSFSPLKNTYEGSTAFKEYLYKHFSLIEESMHIGRYIVSSNSGTVIAQGRMTQKIKSSGITHEVNCEHFYEIENGKIKKIDYHCN